MMSKEELNRRLHQAKIVGNTATMRVSRMLCKKGNFTRMNWQF